MKRGAYPVWLTIWGAGSFANALIFTVTAVYFVTEVGLNPFELVLVGTVMEVTVFLFEIPTGVLADTYSRRLSVIVAFVLQGGGMILVGLVPSFAAILAGYVIWGIGATCESGALDAWITDEPHGRSLERVFLRGHQVGYVGSLLGIGASVALASADLTAPIVLGGALSILLGLALVAVMPERGFRRVPTDERASWRALGETARGGARLVRRSHLLLAVLGIAFFFGAFSESLDRLKEAQLILDIGLPAIGDLDPVVWFGIIAAAALVLSLVATGLAAHRISAAGERPAVRALLALNSVILVGALVFALAGSFALAVVAYLTAAVARNVEAPVFSAWLNRNVESPQRATVLSIVAQSDAVGQWAGGPGIGAVGTIFSLRAALVAGSILLTPALVLYGWLLRRGHDDSPASSGQIV